MYQGAVLLLLALFAAVVTSQQDTQACNDATRALANNRPCATAFLNIGDSVQDNDATINRGDLNAFCSSSCRGLAAVILTACSDSDNGTLFSAGLFDFVCTVDGDVSCFDSITSQFSAMEDTLDAAVDAACNETNTETCSPACAMAVQNYVNAGGCCLVESLEFANQFIEDIDIIETIMSVCSVTLPGGCQMIGAANGVVASVSVLLISIIIATVF